MSFAADLQILKSGLALSLGPTEFKKLEAKIATVASVVRLPLPSDGTCNKTPMVKRWVTGPPESYIMANDPRYATQEDCLRIEAELWAQLVELVDLPTPADPVVASATKILGREVSLGAARCVKTLEPLTLGAIKIAATMSTTQVGTAELPVEYRVDLRGGGKHSPGNLAWTRTPSDLLSLRALLATNGVPKKLLDKVQVKSHATDKVTMPPHFSNRDYRWATWTTSEQFASRTECYAVELELLAQILEFEGAPVLVDATRKEVELHLGRPLTLDHRHCAITGVRLRYSDFITAVTAPAAGKSPYHVGHLVPLTRGGKHEKSNVVWMTEQGNRIQGNDTLDEIVALIKTAADFHRGAGR